MSTVEPAPRPDDSDAQRAAAADVIFLGGPIITVNDAAPRAEALAVRRGFISVVGAKDDVLAQQGPQTRIVNLDGHALLPGFIDPHMHIAFVPLDAWLDVGPFTTKDMDEAVAKLRAAVQQ
ncbi:MAG: amidohydrolase family protein, partial [Dehalococcoidia bacterium]